jgi:hypothetical protein
MDTDNVIAFVRESNKIEGILREPTLQEIYATKFFLRLEKLTISELVDLVNVYQPGAKPRFAAGMNVQVGNHYPPQGGPSVQGQLVHLLGSANIGDLDPWQLHIRYETLHPFMDGNGRSGRAIWLWQMGVAYRPELGFLHSFYYQTLQHVGR